MMKQLLLDQLSGLSNHVMTLDDETFSEFKALSGHVVLVRITDLDQALYLELTEDGFKWHDHFDAVPNTTIQGTLFALFKYGKDQSENRPLTRTDVEIIGDTELGERMHKLMQKLDLDWEEGASRIVGDQAAHYLGNAIRNTRDFAKQCKSSVTQNLSEYLKHEVQLLPTEHAIEKFNSDVNTIRNDVDRLEARVNLLAKGHKA